MSVVIYMQPRFFGNNYFRKSAHSAARVALQCLKEVFNMSTSKEVSLQSFCEGAVKAFSFQVCLSTLHADNTQDCHCFTRNIYYMVLLHILLCLALASFPGSPPHRMMSASNFSLLHKGRAWEPGYINTAYNIPV